MSSKADATSGQVIEALRSGPLREPAHSWLYEVRNRTGYSGHVRYADALVTSLYPSRGLWLAGIEVKVSRSDWKSELDQPSKSAELQRFCDYWWVAAPAGVVELSEIPESWGCYLIEGKRVKVAKKAPKLTPEPYTVEFIASLMRNLGDKVNAAHQRGRDEGWLKAREEFGPEAIAAAREAKSEADARVIQLEREARQLEALKANIRDFEIGAGLKEGDLCIREYRSAYRQDDHQGIGRLFALARFLQSRELSDITQSVRRLESALSEARSLATEAAE